MSEFLTVYPGWNIWQVWQVKDLPFSVMMVGVSPDRQLRIWVEDKVRLGASGAVVADPIDLKGGQIELLQGTPEGLVTDQRKEQVPGPSMFVSGPANLRTLRFFNRGSKAFMAWPHDESYLLEKTFVPSPTNPATSGPPPTTIPETVGNGVVSPVTEAAKQATPLLIIGAVLTGLYLFKDVIFNATRSFTRNRGSARSRRGQG